jgi:hypothetical protein
MGLRLVIGIFMLLGGVVYPMYAVTWFNKRVQQQPPLTPKAVGLLLAFNGIMPLSLVLWGLGMLSPSLWGNLALRVVAIMTTVAAVFLLRLVREALPPPRRRSHDR